MKRNIKRALGEHSMKAAVHAVYTSAAQEDTGDLEEQEPPQWLPVSNRDSQSCSEHSQLHKMINFPI